MKEATMQGSPTTGLVQFNWEGGQAFVRQAPDTHTWYTYATTNNEISGPYPEYMPALEEMKLHLAAGGIIVPELEPLGGTTWARRSIVFACIALLAFVAAFLLGSVAGCESGASRKEPALQTHRWLPGDLLVPVMSADLDECHQASIAAALVWAEHRAKVKRFGNLSVVPQDQLSITGTPAYRVIEFSAEPPRAPKEKELAHTEIFDLNNYAPDRGVFVAHSAQVRSYTCSVSAYIHEVLHVLGLGHGVGTLMDAAHGKDQNGKGGDIDNMTLLPAELTILRL